MAGGRSSLKTETSSHTFCVFSGPKGSVLDFDNVVNDAEVRFLGAKEDRATEVLSAPRRPAFVYRGKFDADDIPKPGEQKKKFIHEGKERESLNKVALRAVHCTHRCYFTEGSDGSSTFHSPFNHGLRRTRKKDDPKLYLITNVFEILIFSI